MMTPLPAKTGVKRKKAAAIISRPNAKEIATRSTRTGFVPLPIVRRSFCGKDSRLAEDSRIRRYLSRNIRLIVRQTIKKVPFTRLCTGDGPCICLQFCQSLHDSAPMLHQRQIKSIGC